MSLLNAFTAPEYLFIIAFFACFILWVIVVFRKQINSIASTVTVIGVLGTFCGIAWGLAQFDTSNPDESIPRLLDGLMFAFVTSIFGILASVVIKLAVLYDQKRQVEKGQVYAASGATVDDLAKLLSEMLSNQQANAKENREVQSAVVSALTGDGDSTVLTQLQKLRTSFMDKQDEVIRTLNAFSEQMAQDNTNALIEALESVMRDFNAKINEQFGENFAQLNEAVGRLNTWQEQYRQQVEKSQQALEQTLVGMEQSRQSLAEIAEHSGTIVAASERLEPILSDMHRQADSLNGTLEAFSTLSDNARGAFPIIEERLNNLTESFARTAQEMIRTSNTGIQTQREALDRNAKQIEEMAQATNERIEQTISTANSKLTSATEQLFRESTSAMTDQVARLDAALQEELTKSITSLGSQLLSLSQEFVKDYTPLTQSLRNVVRLAEQTSSTSRR